EQFASCDMSIFEGVGGVPSSVTLPVIEPSSPFDAYVGFFVPPSPPSPPSVLLRFVQAPKTSIRDMSTAALVISIRRNIAFLSICLSATSRETALIKSLTPLNSQRHCRGTLRMRRTQGASLYDAPAAPAPSALPRVRSYARRMDAPAYCLLHTAYCSSTRTPASIPGAGRFRSSTSPCSRSSRRRGRSPATRACGKSLLLVGSNLEHVPDQQIDMVLVVRLERWRSRSAEHPSIVSGVLLEQSGRHRSARRNE